MGVVASANAFATSKVSSTGGPNSSSGMVMAHGGNSTAGMRYKGVALSSRSRPLLPTSSQKHSVVAMAVNYPTMSGGSGDTTGRGFGK